MTDARPTRRRRRRLVPILLLGAGVWVIATRRRSEPVDVWAPRPPAAPAVPARNGSAPDGIAPARNGSVPDEPARRPSPVPRDRASGIRPLASAPAAAPLTAAPPAAPPPVPSSPVAPAPAVMPPAAAPPATSAPVPSPPAAEPSPEATPSRFGPGSAAPLPDGSAPGPEFTIKGNAGSMLFHPPSSPYYGRTKAEVWFRTPEDAVAAGFTAYAPRRKSS